MMTNMLLTGIVGRLSFRNSIQRATVIQLKLSQTSLILIWFSLKNVIKTTCIHLNIFSNVMYNTVHYLLFSKEPN